MWQLLNRAIIQPAKQYIPFLLLTSGIFLITAGSIFGGYIDGLPLIPHGTGEVMSKAGGGILGAGVFAVIMKSAQFTEYFQRNIHDVFYRPDSLDSVESTRYKWEKITKHLLKDTLPASHQDATSVIMKKFFDNELAFHFERFEAAYDISLSEDKRYANITHTIKADVVISPGHESVEINQQISTDGSLKLTSLVIDNKPVDIAAHLSKDCDNDGFYNFSVTVRPSTSSCQPASDRRVTIERSYEHVQDLEKEPYLMAAFVRYVKGFVLQAKCHNCNVFFSTTGTIDDPEMSMDAQGNMRWVLADRDRKSVV